MSSTNCKNCGAPLSYKNGICHCEYCGTTYHNEINDVFFYGDSKFAVESIEYDYPLIYASRNIRGELCRNFARCKRKITLTEL